LKKFSERNLTSECNIKQAEVLQKIVHISGKISAFCSSFRQISLDATPLIDIPPPDAQRTDGSILLPEKCIWPCYVKHLSNSQTHDEYLCKNSITQVDFYRAACNADAV